MSVSTSAGRCSSSWTTSKRRSTGQIAQNVPAHCTHKLAGGGTVRIPFNVVREFPPMREAVSALGGAIRRGIGLSALVLIPAFAAFWWFAERFGGKSKERKHERGAMLVTLDELEAEIDRHNRAERARELHASLGWKWRLAGTAATEEAGFYSPAHLAGVSWPWRLQTSHTILIGTTGTGRSEERPGGKACGGKCRT